MAPTDDILHDPELDASVAELIEAARAARPAADPARVDATVSLLLGELGTGTAPSAEPEVVPPHLLQAVSRAKRRMLWWWLGGLLALLVVLGLLLLGGDDEAPASSDSVNVSEKTDAVDDATPTVPPRAERDQPEPATTTPIEPGGDGTATGGSGSSGTREPAPSSSTTPSEPLGEPVPGPGPDGATDDDTGSDDTTTEETTPPPATTPTPTTPTPPVTDPGTTGPNTPPTGDGTGRPQRPPVAGTPPGTVDPGPQGPVIL